MNASEQHDEAAGYPHIALCDHCGGKLDGLYRHECKPPSVRLPFAYSVTAENGSVLYLVSESYATAHAEKHGGTARHGERVLGSWPVPEWVRRIERAAKAAAARPGRRFDFPRRAA